MLSPLLLGPNQTPKICEIKYNICVQKQTNLDPMSESNPSSNIYQNDTCPQLLNTRDQKSAHLSAMFGSKVQKLQFYVWTNSLSKTSISADYVSLCFSASDTKILQDKVQCLTLKPSKCYHYIWSKTSLPTIHVLSSPLETKKITKPAIYKSKVFPPILHVWSKTSTKNSMATTHVLSSTRRNQRPKGYQIKYNIYIQIIVARVPCVQNFYLNKRCPLSRSTREHRITRLNHISIFKMYLL